MKVIYLLLFLILLSSGTIYFKQEALIFRPVKLDRSFDLTSEDRNLEEINISVDENVTLNAVYRNSNSGKLIVYFHGNAGSLKNWKNVIRNFPDVWSVLVVDYRGYGKSDGRISSEEQFLDDGIKVYEYAINNFRPSEVVVYGRSIGSGVASFVASRFNPSKVILESPYYSLSSLAAEVFPMIPTFLLRYKIESAKFLKKTKSNIFIIHGVKDSLINVSHSKRIKDEISRANLTTVSNGGHNNLSSFDEYSDFLSHVFSN